MEGSRIMPEAVNKPKMYIDYSSYPSLKSLKVGDKGALSFSGEIVGERKDEENDKIFKTIKVSKLSPNNEKNARITK